MESVLFMKNTIKKSILDYLQSTSESSSTLDLNPMSVKIEEELQKALDKKFFCPSKFSTEIEILVRDNKDMNYIDAIIHFCSKNNIDIESVPKLISKPLKEKLKYDAIELNFLKRTSRAKLVF